MLADRAGDRHCRSMEYSKRREARRRTCKTALLEINQLAANYYYYQLKQPQGKVGYDYLSRAEADGRDDPAFRTGIFQ